MGLVDWIRGSKTIPVAPILQPNLIATAPVESVIDHTFYVAPANIFTMDILAVAPTGYSIPDPVHYTGIPEMPVITGTAATKATNSPQRKCK